MVRLRLPPRPLSVATSQKREARRAGRLPTMSGTRTSSFGRLVAPYHSPARFCSHLRYSYFTYRFDDLVEVFGDRRVDVVLVFYLFKLVDVLSDETQIAASVGESDQRCSLSGNKHLFALVEWSATTTTYDVGDASVFKVRVPAVEVVGHVHSVALLEHQRHLAECNRSSSGQHGSSPNIRKGRTISRATAALPLLTWRKCLVHRPPAT